MSLFTSSSKKIHFRTMVAILVTMTISIGIIRLFTYLMDASAATFLGRVLEAREALPQITQEPEDLVMFFGSSMTRAAFSPRQFDAGMNDRGIAIKSFNFGFGGLNPLFQDTLSRRIKAAFQKDNRRLKLALIEFNPFQTTQIRRHRARAIEDSYFTLLASHRELFELALADPERGVRLYNIRYLRDSISAEMITSHFANAFQKPRQTSSFEEDAAMAKKRVELEEELGKRFEQDYPNYVASNWSYEWQGGGTIPEERSGETLQIFDEYYATLRTRYHMDSDRLSRIRTADIIDLHFEEALVASFINIVKQFQQFSDQVEVILLPKNTDWIHCPPEAMQRMQQVIARIARETGATIRNFQVTEDIKTAMFRDTTHLNRYSGAVTFTSLLIQQYATLLQ